MYQSYLLSLKKDQQALPKDIQEFLNKSTVIYSNIKLPGHQSSKVYQCMSSLERWSCNDLRISNFDKLPFLKSFQSITFTNLKTLYLGWNKVNSIESLSRINTQNLEEIYLWHNDITQVRSLRKANFSKLTLLVLKSNRIMQMESSGECNWISLKIVQLENIGAPVQIQSINFFTKIESRNKLKINANSKKRIKQEVLENLLLTQLH